MKRGFFRGFAILLAMALLVPMAGIAEEIEVIEIESESAPAPAEVLELELGAEPLDGDSAPTAGATGEVPAEAQPEALKEAPTEAGRVNGTKYGVPTDLTLGVKETYTLKCTKKKLTYESSAPKIATVSDKGVVKGKKKGSATITVYSNKKRIATCAVTVVAAPKKVSLGIKSATLGVKESLTLSPTLTEGSHATLSYSSKDKKIATVSGDGKVVGKKKGKTTITVKTHNGVKATLAVTVKAAPDDVTLSESALKLEVGKTAKLKATLTKNSASRLTWATSKKKIATVDENGVVTALAAGKAKITVKTFNGKQATCTVTVVKASVDAKAVSIDKAHFPDAGFRKAVACYDKDGDGILSVEELGKVESLRDALSWADDQNISFSKLDGIEYFYALKELCDGEVQNDVEVAWSCFALTELDLRKCANLKKIIFYLTDLKSVNVSGLTNLKLLSLTYARKLKTLNAKDCVNLEEIYLYNPPIEGKLTSFDISGCASLKDLFLTCGEIKTIKLDGNTLPKLENLVLYAEGSSVSIVNSTLRSIKIEAKSLKLSNCTKLVNLDAEKLSSMTIDNCPGLKKMKLFACNLTSLDLRSFQKLKSLDCSCNYKLTNLKLSGCKELTELRWEDNALTSLNVSGFTNLELLDCDGDLLKNINASGCTKLKSLLFSEELTTLDASGCTSLISLSPNYYWSHLASLNVSGCTSLTSLSTSPWGLTSLNASGCTGLTSLDCSWNQLTSLNISGCTKLEEIYCGSNQLTSLNVGNCKKLRILSCGPNKLTALNVSGCAGLTTLDCTGNPLKNLNASGCTKLNSLSLPDQLTALDISGCASLQEVSVGDTGLTSLNVSGCTGLKKLYCSGNQLTSLDVSSCTGLTSLDCIWNQLTSLNVSGCTALTALDCNDNQLTSLNVSGCTGLTSLSCHENQLTSLDVSGCTRLTTLYGNDNQLTSLNVSGCTSLKLLNCTGNPLTSLDASGCAKLKGIDANEGHLKSLNISGCVSLESLSCSFANPTSLDLRAFKALKNLDFSNDESKLTSLNVSGCTELELLNCYGNPLKNLNASGCAKLNELLLPDKLTALDISRCASLQQLYVNDKGLTSLNVSGCTGLTDLDCRGNPLTSLDLSGCTSLEGVVCIDNQLTSLNASNCKKLRELYCRNNKLTALNVSGCTGLTFLDCTGNQLTSLDVSGCPSDIEVYCDDGVTITR